MAVGDVRIAFCLIFRARPRNMRQNRLHFSLRPRARTWLGIPDQAPLGARERVAASRRLYRGLDRITTLLDPARCDRRRRLPLPDAEALAAKWESPAGRQVADRLQQLANQLVLAPVRIAQRRGDLRGWHGDVGVDATAIPVLANPDSDRTGLGSVEITAGWHYSGGSDVGVFGYSAALVIAAHRRDHRTTPKAYPQMCLGFVLDRPTVRTGQNAITALRQLNELRLPVGICAADRAYTGQAPHNFQVPARRLGYRLALDYKAGERGRQGSWDGAPLVDGSLTCPLTPTALVEATTGADDRAIRLRGTELQDAIAAREPYFLKLKQGADQRGAIRLQCPASGRDRPEPASRPQPSPGSPSHRPAPPRRVVQPAARGHSAPGLPVLRNHRARRRER